MLVFIVSVKTSNAFVFFFTFYCTNHQPISITYLIQRVNHVKHFIWLCVLSMFFLMLIWPKHQPKTPSPSWVHPLYLITEISLGRKKTRSNFDSFICVAFSAETFISELVQMKGQGSAEAVAAISYNGTCYMFSLFCICFIVHFVNFSSSNMYMLCSSINETILRRIAFPKIVTQRVEVSWYIFKFWHTSQLTYVELVTALWGIWACSDKLWTSSSFNIYWEIWSVRKITELQKILKGY